MKAEIRNGAIASMLIIGILYALWFMMCDVVHIMNSNAEQGAASCLAKKCDRGIPVPEFNGFGTICTCKENEPHD